MKNSAFNDAEV